MVRTMEVIVMKEEREASGALVGMGVGVSVGPFAEGGLEEVLGLAVGFRSGEACEAVLEAEAGDLGGRRLGRPATWEARARERSAGPLSGEMRRMRTPSLLKKAREAWSKAMTLRAVSSGRSWAKEIRE